MEKLLQVVLQRRPGQQQLVLQRVVVQHPEKLQQETQRGRSSASVEHHLVVYLGAKGKQMLIKASELNNGGCRYLGLVVFQSVGLVHHQTGPVYGAQDRHVDGDQLV